MRGRGLLVLAVCLAMATVPVECWGQVGHRVVAAVAEAFLEPSAHAAVAAQLAPTGIVGLPDIANLPDYYDHETRGAWSSPHHYVNLLPDATHFTVWPLCMENGGCVVSAVYNYTIILHEDYSNGTVQLCDDTQGPFGHVVFEPCPLSFLVHFVGDIHQPLHAGYASDYGGNLYNVTFFGAPAQLHGVWDYDIIDLYLYREGLHWESFADELIAELKANPDVVASYAEDTSANDWASESFDIMRITNYNFQPGTVPLVPLRHNFTGGYSRDRVERVTSGIHREEYECLGEVEEMYYTRNLPVIKERLAMGGIRLATTLNSVYTSQETSVASEILENAQERMAELSEHIKARNIDVNDVEMKRCACSRSG